MDYLHEVRQIHKNLTLGLLDLARFSNECGINVKRDGEKAGTLFLLKQMIGSHFELNYTSHNRPFLKGKPEHISISHSHGKLAITVNLTEETGVDIELVRDKVINIQDKFASERELGFSRNDAGKLVTVWAAKEAMYKAYGKKELNFIENIFVDGVSGNELSGRVKIQGEVRNYAMRTEQIDDHRLVYVTHEIRNAG